MSHQLDMHTFGLKLNTWVKFNYLKRLVVVARHNFKSVKNESPESALEGLTQ